MKKIVNPSSHCLISGITKNAYSQIQDYMIGQTNKSQPILLPLRDGRVAEFNPITQKMGPLKWNH